MARHKDPLAPRDVGTTHVGELLDKWVHSELPKPALNALPEGARMEEQIPGLQSEGAMLPPCTHRVNDQIAEISSLYTPFWQSRGQPGALSFCATRDLRDNCATPASAEGPCEFLRRNTDIR